MHGSRTCSIAHIHEQIDIKYLISFKLFNFAEQWKIVEGLRTKSSRSWSLLADKARVVTFSRSRSSTAPLLKHLHWLPVSARIHFKIALLTFKSLHAIAPSYLSSLVRPYVPSRALRSSSTHQLCVPHVSTVFGSRGFRSAGPTIWNSLPLSVTSCSTIHTFKKQLKTHMFASAFPSSWIVPDAPLIRWSPFMYLFGCPWFCACLNVCYYYCYYY